MMQAEKDTGRKVAVSMKVKATIEHRIYKKLKNQNIYLYTHALVLLHKG